MRKTFLQVALILLVTMSAILAIKVIFGGSERPLLSSLEKKMSATFKLLAPREHNGKIPSTYTCDEKNINPPLRIEGTPEDAKSLVLLMDDPDIPQFAKDNFHVEVRDHRVVFNMPPTTKKLEENATPPGIQGKNTRGENAYGGPCPPDKQHRYFFKLYALDTLLDLKEGATKAQVEKAMEGHIITQTELIGLYQRQ